MRVTAREAREARGWTVSELARQARLSRMTVYAAERGDRVRLECLIRIAKALGVPLADIFPDAAETLQAVG